jgi:outer membrane protein OmpU
MKKLLIGTTALVAAGSLATGAQAADPIKMSVGGYFQAMIAVGDQTDSTVGSRRSSEVQREGEIIFNGSTKLDNGVKVGVQVQLEAETSGDQIDETFIYFTGGFGRIELGAENSAPYKMQYTAPEVGFGINSPNFKHFAAGPNVAAAGVISTRSQMTSDAEKLTYYTPRIAGFQGGISWTPSPDVANGGQSSSSYRGFQTNTNTGAYEDSIEIGVNFVKKFGGVSVALSGGYGRESLQATTAGRDDRTEWNVGGSVSVAGFTVGGAWRVDDGGVAGANNELSVGALGVSYGRGAWKVGLSYLYAQAERGRTTATTSTAHEYQGFNLGAQYTLGPGVSVRAGIQFHDLDNNVAGTNAGDNEATVFYVGTALSF